MQHREKKKKLRTPGLVGRKEIIKIRAEINEKGTKETIDRKSVV